LYCNKINKLTIYIDQPFINEKGFHIVVKA
jgi:hypothetical protein